MENGLFFSQEVVERALDSLKGVDASNKSAQNDPQALQALDLQPDRFQSRFSDTSHCVVDMDLDEWAANKQAERIGLRYLYEEPPLDAPAWSTAPHHFTEAVLEKREQDDEEGVLKPYPTSFPEYQGPLVRQMVIYQDKSNNPEKYSLKASLKITGVKRERDADEEESKSQAADEEMRGVAAAGEKRRYDPACFVDDDVEEDDDDEDDFVFEPASKRAHVASAPCSQQPPQVGYNAFAPFVVNVNGAARFTAEQVAEADRMRN
jgi:hypothetical protein